MTIDITGTGIPTVQIIPIAGGDVATVLQAQGDVLDDLNALGPNAAANAFLVGGSAGVLLWKSGSAARRSLGVLFYATRTEFITDGPSVDDGVVAWAGREAYVAASGATQIADIPGWLPFGDVYPDHYGENVTPGTTDVSALVSAAILNNTTVHLKDNEYYYPFSSTNGISIPADTEIIGKGRKSVLHFAPDDATYRNAIRCASDNVKFMSLALKITPFSGGSISVVSWQNSNLSFFDVEFDGGLTDALVTGGALVYGIIMPSTGTYSGLILDGCYTHNVTRGVLKANSNTSNQTGLKFIRSHWRDVHKNGLGLNTPNGSIKDVTIDDCKFDYSGGLTLDAVPIQVALASVEDFSIVNSHFEGASVEAIHLEEACLNGSISGNRITSEGVGINVQENDVAGTYSRPTSITVSGNTLVKGGTAKSAGSIGIALRNTAAGTEPPADLVLITKNVISNYERGLENHSNSGSGCNIEGNTVDNCLVGITQTSKSSTVKGNTTRVCDTALSLARGGIVHDHVSIEDTLLVEAGNRATLIHNITFKFDQFAISAGVSNYKDMVLLNPNDRLDAKVSYVSADDGTGLNYARESFGVTWDGTTFSSNLIVGYQAGALAVGLVKNGSFLALQNYSTSARNVDAEVVIDGFISTGTA